jgi:oligopeptide/dipeptide ABC transporter ATP-binding protein
MAWLQRKTGAKQASSLTARPARRLGSRRKKSVALLEVKDLHVSFPTSDGVVRAVRGVTFDVEAGKTLGIVGESGSGKTVLTQTLLGLTPGADVEGIAMFEGTDLLGLSQEKLRHVRGERIAVIFQDPLTSLHPLYRVGWQIAEMIRAHDKSVSKKEANQRAVELLGRVGIPRPETRVHDYPHQFSGGMRQRAMIAMALSLEPKLIIADEPTTALDATVQAQILDLLLRLQQDSGTALIMITHDLGVVADIADDVMVMYAGRAAERAPKRDVFYKPHHPYTKGLLESIPSSSASGSRLKPIPGSPPSLINLPSGCKFNPRCGYVLDRCLKEEPVLHPVAESGLHTSACFLPAQAAGLSEKAEELREEMVRQQRGEQAAEVAAAAAAELGVPAGDEGSVV